MKLSEIQLVPEIQALFQENNEYDAIKADIAERGIQDPVKVNKHNRLLAGYTRVKIAQELGLDEVPHVVVDVDGDMNAMIEYAILDNIRRRQLTDLQLVEYGMKLEELYEGRQGGDRRSEDFQEGQNVHLESGKTRDLVAAKISEQSGVKMSGKKYERLKTIAIKAVPEVKQKLKEGEITQSKALELANYSPEMQATLLEIDSWIYATFVKPELEADGKLTPEIKKKIALKIVSAIHWWWGDLLNAYEKTFGEKKCKQFMRELANRL